MRGKIIICLEDSASRERFAEFFVIAIAKNFVVGYVFNLCENSISIVILGRVLCASGTCLARTEAERRRDSA